MLDAAPIRIEGFTKRFGAVAAVDDVTFDAQPGRVTGFLGPNGAGKSTTLRALLGLQRPTSGTLLIGDKPYEQLENPSLRVGASLESNAFHPSRTGRNHLKVQAAAAGIDSDRIDAVLEQVGLTAAADRSIGGYSLGMRQRIGLATALLGDPSVLVLDEPANGLDPEGIRWLRDLLASLAAEGRTVLLSSHQLREVQQIADDLAIISRGRLVYSGPLSGLELDAALVVVDGPDRAGLVAALAATDATVESSDAGLRVRGLSAAEIGHLAFARGLELHQLASQNLDLEQVFLDVIARAASEETTIDHAGTSQKGASA